MRYIPLTPSREKKFSVGSNFTIFNCVKPHLGSFQCAEDKVTSNLVRQYGGLDPLIALLVSEKTRQNKTLLASVTGAVRKCSSNVENIRRLDELDTVTILIQLLNYESELVILSVENYKP